MFLKTCFACGAKVKVLHEGQCESCISQERPPIKEVKPLNFKICNMSKKICYKNHYYEQEEIVDMIEDLAKKHVVLDEIYKLEALHVENFEIDGHKVTFDINVECDFKI